MSKNTQAVLWAVVNAGFMALAVAVANGEVAQFPKALLWIFPVVTAMLTAFSPYIKKGG